MTILVSIVHVLMCLLLIFIVLIQGGKGAEVGAAFGGSSQTLFGSRGATTFLGKLTTVFAALFMLTSLVLTVTNLRGGGTVMKPGVVRQVPMNQMPAPIQKTPIPKK
ncbi:MAG: preprotein translocase subunit SecG [Nitrospiraceae bacterium]|nr:preprotein translocase subunit SecG [Nitrospiraceae bacterium]